MIDMLKPVKRTAPSFKDHLETTNNLEVERMIRFVSKEPSRGSMKNELD